MTRPLLESLIREILAEAEKLKPRPPGYEEALRDTERTNQSIADEFGVSEPTVRKDRKALGVEPRPRGGPYNKKVRPPGYEEALRDTTRSIKRIAADFGLVSRTVHNDRIDRGIVTGRETGRPGSARPRPPGYEEALRDAEKTAQSIADEFGFESTTVYRDRADRGIVTGRELGPGGSARPRPPGYDEALRDTERSSRSIASQFGLAYVTVRKDRKDRGIVTGRELGPRASGSPQVYEEDPEEEELTYDDVLWDLTRSDQQVANMFGVSPRKVANDRQRLGIL
jgi:hypothetical protein